jgi:hypothetical protein
MSGQRVGYAPAQYGGSEPSRQLEDVAVDRVFTDRRRQGSRWSAWVVWIDATAAKPRIVYGWVPADNLRPARSLI